MWGQITYVPHGLRHSVLTLLISMDRRLAGEMHLMFRLRLFGITKPGMIGLTLAVCALWGCLASERITTRHAQNDLRASLRNIVMLRSRGTVVPGTRPVSRPAPPAGTPTS